MRSFFRVGAGAALSKAQSNEAACGECGDTERWNVRQRDGKRPGWSRRGPGKVRRVGKSQDVEPDAWSLSRLCHLLTVTGK